MASAARPGTLIASGEAPSIAVDANGTGYIAYNDEPPGQVDEPVGLCVIPAGASQCSSNQDVLADGQSGEAQPALISASGNGQLTIVSGRCCFDNDEVMTSTDGGASFSDPVSIGGLTYFDGAIGPGGDVLLVNYNTDFSINSQISSAASPAGDSATLFNPQPGDSAVAGWSGGTPVVVASGSETYAAIYSGSGDPNDGASWNNVRVPGSTFDPSMASGPDGLFLLQDTGDFQRRLTIRRFDGNGFGPAHVITITNESQGTALAEDPSGRLVAVWYDDGTMFASASRDLGVHWSRPRVVATEVNLPSRMEAALGPNGNGWLVYDLNAGSEIRVFPLSVDALLGIRAAPPPHKVHHRHHRPKPRRHKAKKHRHPKPHHPKAKKHRGHRHRKRKR